MPRADDHLDLANRTHASLECLIVGGMAHAPWIATLSFYKALHVVEALFASTGVKRSTSHEDRDKQLRQNRFKHVFQNYRALATASAIARYLSDRNGTAFRRFEDFLDAQGVLTHLVHHRLHQVEESATKMMGATNVTLLRTKVLPKSFVNSAPTQSNAPDASRPA